MANVGAKRACKALPKTFGEVQVEIITTDLLIIGGGNAGCFVAVEAKKINPNLNVTIMEKAN
ncbi:MAG: hypothetical protein WBV23_10445, partial [Desulfobaccales bacterium]